MMSHRACARFGLLGVTVVCVTVSEKHSQFNTAHADVGGGSVESDTPHSLARIPLRWMIRECFRANTGILFYRESLKRVGINPDTLLDLYPPAPTPSSQATQVEAPIHSRGSSGRTLVDLTEESEELEDVRTPMYDQLKIRKAWWILELIPIRLSEQILMHDHYLWKHHWEYVFVLCTIFYHSHGYGSPAG